MTRNKSQDTLKKVTGGTLAGTLAGSGGGGTGNSRVEVLYGKQENVTDMADIIPTKPWTRLHLAFTGIIENRSTNTTPRWRVAWKDGSNRSFIDDFAHGAWWSDSHTSYDYGSSTHVRSNEIVGLDTMSLGWLAGDNRDLGQGAAFHLELHAVEVNGRLSVNSHWYGMRRTLDYLVHMKGSYTWFAKTSDLAAMDLWFGSSIFSYTYKAEFHR